MWPVDFQATTLFPPAGLPIIVQSPNGFTAPVPTAAAPYWAIAMKNDGTGTCTMVQVTAATAPDPQGRVTLTQSAAHHTAAVYAVGPPARLLNLGPQGQATRVQYDVDDVNKVLRTTDLLTAACAQSARAERRADEGAIRNRRRTATASLIAGPRPMPRLAATIPTPRCAR